MITIAEVTTYAILGGFIVLLTLMHLVFKSRIFGVFVGLTLAVTGFFVLIDGVDFKSGEIRELIENTTPEYLNVTNIYTNLKDTNNNQNTLFGLSAILIGIYMVLDNGIRFFQNKNSGAE